MTASDQAGADAIFEAHRPYLFGIAYRMLGTGADADDVLQEAWLRWHQVEEKVESPRAWLSTVVTRLCLDVLTSARRKREVYVGPWLPEPVGASHFEPLDVAQLSLAFMVVLESLSPLERAAFVMREVFDYDFEEIGRILGREEAAIRKLVQRARAHVQERRPRFARTPEDHERLLRSFLGAVSNGDPKQLESLLADEVRATADGGGRVAVARNEVIGRDAVTRYLLGIARKAAFDDVDIADVNGGAAVVLRRDGRVLGVVEVESDGTHIYGVRIVMNPDKLARI